MTMQTLDSVKRILTNVLSLSDRGNHLHADSYLLGHLPELDSMAVVHIITSLEDHFGITIHDDEINGQTFETLGTLAAFVDGKLVE